MKFKTTTALLSLSFVFLPIVAKAESTQPTATPSQLYSSSSNSSFQNATFSQSGASGATTASGSASTLLNTPTSSISVSDGPKDAPKVATKNKNSYVVYLYGLMAFSILGFSATFRKKRNTPPVNEVEESTIIVKKPKKQKKKRRNKKHHR